MADLYDEQGELNKAQPGWRARLGGLVRLAVCLVAVAWLYRTVNWQQIRHVVANANWRLALAGLLVYGPAPVLIALRLRWLLAVHDVHLSMWKAVKVTFLGNFVIQALPVGTSGGDAVKAWYVARETPRKHEAVTTVLFDRLIGVVGLVLLSGIMVLVNWNNPAMAHWGRIIGLLVAGLAVGGGLYFSHWFRRLLRLEQIMARLPLAGHLRRLDQAVFEFRNHRRRVIACLLLAMLLQVCCVLAVFLSGWALGLVGEHPWRSFPIYLAYTPICFLSGALPLGVMELIYVQFFAEAAKLGTAGAALSLSLVSRLIQLAWALPGGLSILTERLSARPRRPVTETSTETEAQAATRVRR